jgi:hypothetical protein
VSHLLNALAVTQHPIYVIFALFGSIVNECPASSLRSGVNEFAAEFTIR